MYGKNKIYNIHETVVLQVAKMLEEYKDKRTLKRVIARDNNRNTVPEQSAMKGEGSDRFDWI